MKYTVTLLGFLCLTLTGCGDEKQRCVRLFQSRGRSPLPPEPFSETITIDFGGLERSVLLHIPQDTPADAPLVIDAWML